MRRVPPIANPSGDALLPYRDASAGNYPGSWPGAEFYNSLLAEACHVIEYAGMTLDANDLQQLRKAIVALIAAGGGGGGSGPVSPDFRVVTGGPLTSPPGSPASGSQYLVGASATGAFAGKDYQLASWDGTAWSFATVLVGSVFRISGTDTYYNRVSGGWASFTLPIAIIAGLQTALDDKLSKSTGGTVNGTIAVSVADSANAFLVSLSGAAVAALAPVDRGGGNRALGLYGYGGGAGNGWRAFFDHNGNVGLGGNASPAEKLDVTGNIAASGVVKSAGVNLVRQDRALSTDGLILIGGGTSADLSANRALSIDTTALKSVLGIGKKLIYLASPGGSSITVTFPVAEPDTSYTVVGLTLSDNGSGYLTVAAGVTITGKTVNGFTATGIGTSSINIVFLAAIR